MSSQQQQQQQQEEEESSARSWQQQQQAATASSSSSAGGTPIRRADHKSSTRLSEFIPAGGSSSQSEWRHLTSSPSRLQQQQQRQPSMRTISPHWSSESLLASSSNKDSSGWTLATEQQAVAPPPAPPPLPAPLAQQSTEPFIPPPPLLDFETANLLPPLGIDVSSPSDDLHFMTVNSAGQSDDPAGAGELSSLNCPKGDSGGGVNWVQVPPQYATLRRPRSNNSAVRPGLGEGYSTLRRPRSSSNNAHVGQQHLAGSGGPSSWLLDPAGAVMDNQHHHHHHHCESSGGGCQYLMGRDGMSRKCTCGQKMRLAGHSQQQQQHPQQQQQQQQHGGSGSDRDSSSHIRSDDGLAGIATLRRPAKRKTRSQIPSQLLAASQQGADLCGGGSGLGGGNPPGGMSSSSSSSSAAAVASTSMLQQPKLETSVLLDKLLRAGALRPEDYLVLSRMERMIMANHISSAGQQMVQQQQQQPGRMRSNKMGTASSPADSGVDMRREFELNSSVGQVSTESLYDSSGSQQHLYPRRSSASSDRTGMPGNGGMMPSLPSGGSRSDRPSPGPSLTLDYYHYGGRSADHSALHHHHHHHHHVQRSDVLYPPPSIPPSANRCCPCCGSPSHPHSASATAAAAATCNLCGGGPHQHHAYSSSGVPKLQQPPPPAYGSAVFSTTAASSTRQQHYSAASAANSDLLANKYQSSVVTGQLMQQPPHHPSMMNLKNPQPHPTGSTTSVGQQQHQGTALRPELQQHSLSANEPIRFSMTPNAAQQQQQQSQQIPLGPALHRSISTPTPARTLHQQQSVQPSNHTVSESQQQHRGAVGSNHRVGLSRSLSRTEAVKEYFKQSAATFFGLDESKENELRQRWEDRRRRLAERRCGTLREHSVIEENGESRDLVDGGGSGGMGDSGAAESTDGVCGLVEGPAGSTSMSASQLLLHHRRLKRRESVARMTWDGLAYLATAIVRLRSAGPEEEVGRSRSVSNTVPSTSSTMGPSAALTSSRMRMDTGASAVSAAAAGVTIGPMPPDVTMDVGRAANVVTDPALDDEVFFDVPPPPYEDVVDAAHHGMPPSAQPPSSHVLDSDVRPARWRRAIQSPPTAGPATTSLVDRLMDNSNRRQYGMGVVGRLTRRSLRQSMMENNKHLKSQLDSFEDHRPYFTYWTCTVQVLIMLIALITYGLGPIGFNLHRRSGSVLVTSLSLQEVDYYEPSNFWIGPRAADLIHLGAKYSPCMKPDTRIRADIEATRIRERQTACCIRNDNSGCVQTSRAECSDLTSTWKKWNVVQSGPGGRISGSVCGQDPNFCIEPASVAPFEWPDDITKWPKCRKKLPGLGSESKSNANHVLKTTGQAEHMVCEVIGHPCCIGIHGDCRIATREYCDFVKGYFHQEASLCSQVSCMNDVCGMLPFHTPDLSDQFYRLWTSLFLHAGILHLAVSITFQMVIMRDLEKLAGPLRIGIIYLGSGVIGNLASALFVPYRAEVGPSGSHFGLLACLCVEVLHAWPLLRTPWRALGRLLMTVAFLFVAGLLPWVDNFAHIFGFISGGLLSYTFLPFITVGVYDRRRKLMLISVAMTLCAILLTTLVLLLYVWPIQDAGVIQTLGYLNCVPITRDFCAEQNIHFNKREISIT